jgi:hypothetical protein
MKPWKIILITIVTITIVAFVIFFFTFQKPASPLQNPRTQFPIAPQNSSSSPISQIVKDCYSWYINAYFVNSGSAASDQQATQCFTTNFITQWTTLAENTGGDPVVLAQDYQPSWLNNITVTVLNQMATSSSVLVSLGTDQELKQLIVQLTPDEKGLWKIQSVMNALGNYGR